MAEPPGLETGTVPRTRDCVDLTGEGATFTITISDFAFDPNCFTASASQGITIENQDAADHTFTITGTDVDVPIAAGADLQRRADLGSRGARGPTTSCARSIPTMTGQVTIVA